jgi:hypothetical protein
MIVKKNQVGCVNNTHLKQKQLTCTSLVQFRFALACAKQLDTGIRAKIINERTKFDKGTREGLPQVETPLKLGYCAVLVVLALVADAEELVVLVAVPVAAVVVVVLRLVSCEVEEETVDDAPCDHTMEMKSWRTKNNGMGKCEKFIEGKNSHVQRQIKGIWAARLLYHQRPPSFTVPFKYIYT